MEGPAIDEIAAPLQRLAIGREGEAGKILNRAGGAMFAGNPLRVIERQRAGSDGNREARMEDLTRRFRGVERERDAWCRGFCAGGFMCFLRFLRERERSADHQRD